jgi:hypothetical protein
MGWQKLGWTLYRETGEQRVQGVRGCFTQTVLRLGCDWLSLPVVSFHFDICLLQFCCPLRLQQPLSFIFLYGITFVSPPPQVGCG